ncbi:MULTISPECIES: cytochrome P450 [unclassified Coleofasciculus]|uniref:cytochrome P450 n=1 Tax=unclassified Coleofasciculus TaxID=2692782 RepID=UPI001881ADC8|nr:MULTISPECIES: cytochrome P450 [unclassified Coleofasciculus]MBE9126998.1 cytochrome P450 [Coleofasciculus sp. LEGE 07081]MBE9149105.1 cytochrome P450 [Coleofasciculus sp. LEGE 07092]
MKLPDGPKSSPTMQLIRWIADPLAFLDSCAERYGDTFTLNLRNFEPLVFLSHPQAIQEIFTADPKLFDSGRGNKIVKPLVGENSLLLLDGARHAAQRRLMMPPFHGERMHSYSQLMCEIAEQVASQWNVGKPICIRAQMQEITLQVIVQTVFGLREGVRYQQLIPLLSAMLNMTDSPLSSSLLFFRFLQKDLGAWSPWGRFVGRRQQIYELLQAEIDERRERSQLQGNDVLTLMMSARDELGQPMTDAELKDELMTLLFAGHETTATALAWAFYWIHQRPSIYQKLVQELDSLGENPEPIAIAKLPYLTAVCQETLRIYPVIFFAFPRVTKAPMQVMGRQYDTNTTLFPCIYLTHHREDIYPEPNQFKPERFLDRQFSPYEYLPFGGSNRRCVGFALAQMEMKLVLASILSRYQLTLADTKPVKPQRRGFTVSPEGGVRMMVIGQRSPSERVSVGTASTSTQ